MNTSTSKILNHFEGFGTMNKLAPPEQNPKNLKKNSIKSVFESRKRMSLKTIYLKSKKLL